MATELLESQLEAQFNRSKHLIANRWSKLTAEDIRQINGNFDQFISRLQTRYGYSRSEAMQQIERWLAENNDMRMSDRERTYARPARQEESHMHRSDSTSYLKWILGIGIPLLLLASWLAYDSSREASRQMNNTSTTTTVMPGQFRGDQATLDNIRAAFMSNNLPISNFPNILITASNGVVTLDGTVSTPQQRDMIYNIVRSSNGVTAVNNRIQVR